MLKLNLPKIQKRCKGRKDGDGKWLIADAKGWEM